MDFTIRTQFAGQANHSSCDYKKVFGLLLRLRLALKVILKCLVTTNHTFFSRGPPSKLRLDLSF
jgi:hypothetical protein